MVYYETGVGESLFLGFGREGIKSPSGSGPQYHDETVTFARFPDAHLADATLKFWSTIALTSVAVQTREDCSVP